ncbi:MAG: sensor histidine kinase [Bacteroidales bacterium]
MNIYEKKQRWKLLLFLVAVLIGIGSLTYTNKLVHELSAEERQKIELWAEATQQLISADYENSDLSFQLLVIQNNNSVPVIQTDSAGRIITYRNLDSTKVANNPDYLYDQLEIMKSENDSMVIDLGGDDRNYLYYRDSIFLRKLQYFPYVQLGVIVLFILVSYFAFSSSRKAEQNKVWVGLSKETAHQLGTPTSSLNAWVELLKQEMPSSNTVNELEKDVKRLEKITERFSKIGSKPVLQTTGLHEVLQTSVNYLLSRSSSNITFELLNDDRDINVPLNQALFEWVIENVCKNAMDAMNGRGKVTIQVEDHTQIVYIDISDHGKGIPKSRHKAIFKPGYTTKQRGWGLGLSLSKRIIETYHEGKIFVLSSEPENGTTLRIVLKK